MSIRCRRGPYCSSSSLVPMAVAGLLLTLLGMIVALSSLKARASFASVEDSRTPVTPSAHVCKRGSQGRRAERGGSAAPLVG